jgi:hypothetical protein
VNYFGHAAVASWTSTEPGVALGAMLPDFAGMCRARLDTPADDTVARGIASHHATDAAFHVLPAATALMRELDDRLTRAGCARGPTRAVAHIGVELQLDGVLVDHEPYRAAYLAAIEHDTAGVRWTEGADRFAMLIARLRGYGVPDDLRTVDGVTARLARVLAPRPLLAPSPDDLRIIHRELAAYQSRVEVAADTILRALRNA